MFTEEHLESIERVETILKGECNAGTSHSDEKGYLATRAGLFHMWLVRNGIANLLSLPECERQDWRFLYDLDGDWEAIHRVTKQHITFKRDTGICDRFPYLDLSEKDHVGFAQTVRQRYEGFTREQVKRAILARRAQAMIATPSEKRFKEMVSNRELANCHVTVQDITNAHAIFGPDLPGVRGKTVRRKPSRVEPQYVAIPDDFHKLHRFVTLTADVMFVNGAAFLVTLSRDIRLYTGEYLRSRTADELGRHLTKVVQLYARGGFTVRTCLMDQEFDKIADKVCNGLVEVNTAAAREHVGEIERAIRLIKERCRGIVCTLPYLVYPKQVLVHLVYFCIMWINNFPAEKGISEKYSPREIVTKRVLDFEKHCRGMFGEYVEAHADPDMTNNMQSRTYPAIYLGPTG